jgi:hypothetical protein
MEGMQYGEIFQRQGGSHHLGVSINGGSPIASIAGWWFHGKTQSKMDDLGVPPSTETIIVFLNEGWSWRNRNAQGRSFGPFGRWKCWELSCSTWYKWARDVCMRPTMVVMVVTIYEDMLSFMIINYNLRIYDYNTINYNLIWYPQWIPNMITLDGPWPPTFIWSPHHFRRYSDPYSMTHDCTVILQLSMTI